MLQANSKNKIAENAKNVFRYLAEIKALQTPIIREYKEYETVIWLNDVPREDGCFCEAWELLGEPGEGDGTGAWISVKKPQLTSPPELPDGLDPFVNLKEWRNSSLEQPSLKEVSREQMLRHFLPDEDLEPDHEQLQINENEEVFEEYVKYVDEEWKPWAVTRRKAPDSKTLHPAPAKIIEPWLDLDSLRDHNLDEPSIRDEISVKVDTKFEEAKRLLAKSWANYLSADWHPWAEQDKVLQQVQEIYNQLYTMYQSHQRLGEQYEVVMAFGLLGWNSSRSGRIRRHILVCDALLSFDAVHGQISVTGNPNGLALRPEFDMLEPTDRPQLREMEFIQQQITEVQAAVWDEAFLSDLSKAFVNAIAHDRGEFKMALGRIQPIADVPRIDLAPALMLRKRSQRGYIRLLTDIEKTIEESGEVPGGIREMIDPVAAEAARQERIHAEQRSHADVKGFDTSSYQRNLSTPPPDLKDPEIYFPLPSNKEQYEIAARLRYGRGVLVQGPPGTGKTHTIANLVCHLLAQGKRVLVTSETPRGLQSLQSKFKGPAAPIADLCVLLLGNDAGSLAELERSVQAINTQLNQFNVSQSNERIQHLKEQLMNVRGEKRKAEQELKAIRESDTYNHTNVCNRYSGTLQTIAQKIRGDQDAYGWMEDNVSDDLSAAHIFKSDSEKFVRLWQSQREKIHIDRNAKVIDAAVLPSADDFASLVNEQKLQQASVTEITNTANKLVTAVIERCDPTAIERLQQELRIILAGMRQLKEHVYAWALQVGSEIVSEQDRKWRELLRMSRAEIGRCDAYVHEVAALQVEGVTDENLRQLLKCTEILQQYAAENKKFRKSLLQPKPIKSAFKDLAVIKLDGHAINNPKILEEFIAWLIAKDAIGNLKRLWANLAIISDDALNLQLAEITDLLEPLDLAVKLHDHVTAAQQEIDAIGQFGAPVWTSIAQLDAYVRALDLRNASDSLRSMKERLESIRIKAKSILANSSKLCEYTTSAITSLDTSAYRHGLETLHRQNEAAMKRNELVGIARLLRSKLPNTFKAFNSTPDPEVWVIRFSQLQSAIDWRRASSWLKKFIDSNASEAISLKVQTFEKEEKQFLGELAAQMAWTHCLQRMTEVQRQALIAWLQAISRIGKGTGKHAERHRITARKELKKCQAAIPAWVMPMHRVVESVDPVPEAFDVAIIDEASQSGPEAIILNYIAKKVVVVGDDKQIRPSNIGIDHDEAEHFRKQYLSEIEHSESFGLTSSYFSQAELRFPNYIRLKEHFRCMPEIILFSNQNFYSSDPLVPLRQFGGGRLVPVTVAEYVEDGFRSGHGTSRYNEPEARRIVERIAECCADPAYDDKTMGVICLSGGQQAQLIQKLLIEEIEPEEIEIRNLLVGRPYAFQGDERNVIFLSMMNAPPEGRLCRRVSGLDMEREFNVAASRAIDQMWLFHSATLNDLHPDCLQYKLLAHCKNPRVEQQEIEWLSIDQIRAAATKTDRKAGRQPPPFGSWFEVDVYLKILERDYRVIPQYVVNPFDRTFRIDLVVEGIHGKLAVECDGDQWHGPDRYEHDMARQRELERASWRFWRVRGGVFYYDPDSAMESLWDTLRDNGIYPIGEESAEDDIRAIDNSDELVVKPRKTLVVEEVRAVPPVSERDRNADYSGLFVLEPQQATQAIQSQKKKRDFSARDFQTAIIKVLGDRPNQSIATKSLTQAVCKQLAIITRGQPRMEFDKRIRRSLGVLMRKGLVQEYKAKNVRVRLLAL